MSNVEVFLSLYEGLCRKYGLHISACGCCQSPWVVETKAVITEGDALQEHLRHLRIQRKILGAEAPEAHDGH